MGNKASAPTPAAAPDINRVIQEAQLKAQQQQQQAAPALTGPALCAVKGVELNTLRRDLDKKQAEVDNCNPTEAAQRKLNQAVEENNQYINKQRAEIQTHTSNFEKQATIARQLSVATEPLDSYLDSLTKELDTLRTENEGLERSERANRRRFLDNDPQSGVGGAPAVRTSDDKILLAFWICYGLAVIAVFLVITKLFEAQIGGTGQKVGLGALVLLVAYGIAYYFIAYYA